MKVLKSWVRPSSFSPQTKAFLIFAIAYCIAVQYFRIVSSSDPSSLFVDINRAYQRRYSTTRIEEATDFIANAWDTEEAIKAAPDPTFCVGIATVQRNDARYFKLLVGSLLDGLADSERRDILVLPFIANIDPETHLAYNEPWLHGLADKILSYNNVSASNAARMRTQESAKGHKKKALFDYSYTMQSCLDSGAPYILMLEDDVIAARGWYPRMKASLEELEGQPEYNESLYLRLFYNTRLQGWNKQFWPTYLFWSLVLEILAAGILWTVHRNNASASRFLTLRAISTILFVCTPACIGLYFAAGRLTVQPNPTGIHQMNRFGCCSQAMVFPREQVPPLLKYFKKKKTGLRDELIEKYADDHGLARWALTPSVFQHIGSRSTKWKGKGSDVIDKNGLISTERIWNYHFESWDDGQLQSIRE